LGFSFAMARHSAHGEGNDHGRAPRSAARA
jgi:hypothetical protein